VVRADSADRLDPVQLRHDDVGQNQIEVAIGEKLEALAGAGGSCDVMPRAGEDEGKGVADRHVIVDDQDVATRCGHISHLVGTIYQPVQCFHERLRISSIKCCP
jgi:hypothetical protein